MGLMGKIFCNRFKILAWLFCAEKIFSGRIRGSLRYFLIELLMPAAKVQQVVLDASSMCQLSCPLCITAKTEKRGNVIGRGFLSFNHFKNFVDRHPFIKHIELSAKGEVFLNPELKEIIQYAYEKKISLAANHGVNFNSVSDDVLESLVKFRFQGIKIALDGADDEVYRMYRRDGNFSQVIKNIERLNYFKKKYKSNFPILEWRMILFGHNEHQVKKSREMAAALDMKFSVKLNYNPQYSPIRDVSFVRKISGLGVATREEYKQKFGRIYLNPCLQLWNCIHINWDGSLLGCCLNTQFSYGNVFETGLFNCLNSDRYRYIKKTALGFVRPREDTACFSCKYKNF